MSAAAAIAEARVGVEQMPDDLLPLRRLAVLLAEEDDRTSWEESLALTERTLEIDPHNSGAWRALSTVQRKLGRLDDAEVSMARGVELGADNWRLLAEYALLLDEQGRRADAEAVMDRATRAWTRAGGDRVGPRPQLPEPLLGPARP